MLGGFWSGNMKQSYLCEDLGFIRDGGVKMDLKVV
jgi:hypothetical protein